MPPPRIPRIPRSPTHLLCGHRHTPLLLSRQCLVTPPLRGYAAPSPRARKSADSPRPLTDTEIFMRYNTKTFPMDSFMSAYTAKAISIPPTLALNIIRRYVELSGEISPDSKPDVQHGRILCEEFKISPKTLTQLAILLHRLTPPASPLRPLSSHLLTLSSLLSDPTALIALYHRLLKSPLPPGVPPSAKDSLLREYLTRIEHFAKVSGDPSCAYVWGEYISHQGGLDGGRREEAKGWLRAAGEKGVWEAWLRLGTMEIEDAHGLEERWEKRVEVEIRMAERGREKAMAGKVKGKKREASNPPPPPPANSSGGNINPNLPTPEKVQQHLTSARLALEKAACEGDLPEAHLSLALLLSPKFFYSSPEASEDQEDQEDGIILPPVTPPPQPHLTHLYLHHLTKSACSGNTNAMYYLGSYYFYHHEGKPTQNEQEMNEMRTLGREWIQVAAHGGHAEAMKLFGAILLGEGKGDAGGEWIKAGEWQEVVGEAKRL